MTEDRRMSTKAMRELAGYFQSQPGEITPEELRSAVRYHPDTGVFTASRYLSGNAREGAEIGCSSKASGYRYIRLNKYLYRAHRLAWLYMTGVWPAGVIDHINGIREDNRWGNLRDVNQSANNQNQKKAQARSKSGLLGVVPDRSKWRAQIVVNGKKTTLGNFDSKEEAYQAYLVAKRNLHEACTI